MTETIAGVLAERRLAARARRFDDIGLGLERHAQRLEHEIGIEPVAELEHERHRAHHLVAVGDPVDRAVAGGGVLELGQGRDRALVLRQELARIVAGHGEGAFDRRLARRLLVDQDEGGDDRRMADRARQDRVMGRQLAELAAQRLDLGIVWPLREHPVGRGAVGLGEHHVEGDGGGAHLGQPVDDARDQGARPRPLAELLERGVVDVEDAHRRLGRVERARLEALEAVEHQVAQLHHRRRILRPHEQRERQDDPRDEVQEAAHGARMLRDAPEAA